MWGGGEVETWLTSFLSSAVGRASGEFPVPVASFQVKHFSVRIEQDSEPVWKI